MASTQPGDDKSPPGGGNKKRRSLLPAPKSFTNRQRSPSQVVKLETSNALDDQDSMSEECPGTSAQGLGDDNKDLKQTDQEKKEFKVGDRVTISGVKPGVLRYFGKTHFADGLWCGIALDDQDGKHSGEVDGVRYFTCDDIHGIFAPAGKVQLEATTSRLRFTSKGLPTTIRRPNTGLTQSLHEVCSDNLCKLYENEYDAVDQSGATRRRFKSKLARPKSYAGPSVESTESGIESDVPRSKISKLPLVSNLPGHLPATKGTASESGVPSGEEIFNSTYTKSFKGQAEGINETGDHFVDSDHALIPGVKLSLTLNKESAIPDLLTPPSSHSMGTSLLVPEDEISLYLEDDNCTFSQGSHLVNNTSHLDIFTEEELKKKILVTESTCLSNIFASDRSRNPDDFVPAPILIPSLQSTPLTAGFAMVNKGDDPPCHFTLDGTYGMEAGVVEDLSHTYATGSQESEVLRTDDILSGTFTVETYSVDEGQSPSDTDCINNMSLEAESCKTETGDSDVLLKPNVVDRPQSLLADCNAQSEHAISDTELNSSEGGEATAREDLTPADVESELVQCMMKEDLPPTMNDGEEQMPSISAEDIGGVEMASEDTGHVDLELVDIKTQPIVSCVSTTNTDTAAAESTIKVTEVADCMATDVCCDVTECLLVQPLDPEDRGLIDPLPDTGKECLSPGTTDSENKVSSTTNENGPSSSIMSENCQMATFLEDKVTCISAEAVGDFNIDSCDIKLVDEGSIENNNVMADLLHTQMDKTTTSMVATSLEIIPDCSSGKKADQSNDRHLASHCIDSAENNGTDHKKLNNVIDHKKLNNGTDHKKLNHNVNSTLGSYVKQSNPRNPKIDEKKFQPEKKSNQKTIKNSSNKKKTEFREKISNKQDLKESRRSRSNSVSSHHEQEGETPRKIVKHTPKSKWDNIMSQLEASKSHPPKQKAQVKSKLNIDLHTAQSARVKDKPKPKITHRLPDLSKVKSKLTVETKSSASKKTRVKSPRSGSETNSRSHSPHDGHLDVTDGGKRSSQPPFAGEESNEFGTIPNLVQSAGKSTSTLSLNSESSVQTHISSRSSTKIVAEVNETKMSTKMSKRNSSSSGGVPAPTKKSEPRRISLAVASSQTQVAPPWEKRKTSSRIPSGQSQLNTSTSKKKNQNRNSASKPEVRTTSNCQVKSTVHQPDLVTNSIQGPKTSQEIGRLEALCEARTKELNFLKLQLKQGVLGFEAMSVMVQYLTTELDAFSCPTIVADLQDTKQKLQDTLTQLDVAKKERQQIETDVEDLNTRHKKYVDTLNGDYRHNLKLLEVKLKKEKEDEVQSIINQHSHEVTTLNNYHDRHTTEIESECQTKVEGIKKKHEEEVAKVTKEHAQAMEDFQKQHNEKLQEITRRFENIKVSLSCKVETLRVECDELRAQARHYQEALERDTDHKVQVALMPYKDLPQEIESLKLVIDMRNEEIHQLRHHTLDQAKQLEELPAAREKIISLQQKVENLEAILDIRGDYEKQLSEKHQMLLRKFDRESKANKRLSMDNEELSYKLQFDPDSPEYLRRQVSRSPPGSPSSPTVVRRVRSPFSQSPSGSDFDKSPTHKSSQMRRSWSHLSDKNTKRKSDSHLTLESSSGCENVSTEAPILVLASSKVRNESNMEVVDDMTLM